MKTNEWSPEVRAELRERFSHNPHTGQIFRKRGTREPRPLKPQRSQIVNLRSGPLTVSMSRLMWFLHYGEVPSQRIGNLDKNHLNLKIDNLYIQGRRRNSSIPGVYFVESLRKHSKAPLAHDPRNDINDRDPDA